MLISLIAAMDENRLIGANNALPWHLPADLQHFKAMTMGKPILMGRKTYDSIGRPLPGRTNVVITRDKNWHVDGCVVAHSIEEALASVDAEEVMVMGGASFYEQMISRAGRLYITRIHGQYEGDAWFPEYESDDWRLVSKEYFSADDVNPVGHSFLLYEKLA